MCSFDAVATLTITCHHGGRGPNHGILRNRVLSLDAQAAVVSYFRRFFLIPSHLSPSRARSTYSGLCAAHLPHLASLGLVLLLDIVARTRYTHSSYGRAVFFLQVCKGWWWWSSSSSPSKLNGWYFRWKVSDGWCFRWDTQCTMFTACSSLALPSLNQLVARNPSCSSTVINLGVWRAS
jgi:hypothetical protein